MSLFDHPVVSQRYFFGRAGTPTRPMHVTSGDHTLVCAVHRVFEHAPWIVHFHGNGEVAADYERDIAQTFGRLGVNVLFAEYRGYGDSTGTPKLAAMLDDTEAILAATGAPRDRCVVFGRSVGSIYAIELASRCPDVAGLVIESGIHDVLQRILLRAHPHELDTTLTEIQAEASRLFDHTRKLSSFPNPCLVLHARGDHLVELSHAEHNVSAAPQGRAVFFDAGDHNSIMYTNLDAYFAAVGALVTELFPDWQAP